VLIVAGPPGKQLAPGDRLDDRYELLYPYAQGGMATVWAARVQGKHGFEKIMAVKTILPHVAREESFRSMFLDEARIASRIRHPNVADIDDLGEDGDTLYMVLEWIDGDAWSRLYRAVRRTEPEFPLSLLLRIAADACAGLHAAHELRDEVGRRLDVVHRDVSPQNILVATSGMVKVIDFGIAKAATRLSESTKTGFMKGKAEYVAPEQAQRNTNVDRRADLWAIGTILYQFLSDRLPFEAANEFATLRAIVSGKPPPPLPPSVPEAVAAIVMRALSPVDQRFATGLEMQRALEAAMPEPAGPAEVGAFVRKHMTDRIAMRHRDLASAIADANARAGVAPEIPGPRGMLPTLPPEAMPVLDSPSGILLREEIQTMGTLEIPTGSASPQMRTRHMVIMIFATIVALGVWTKVGHVLLTSPKLQPARMPAPGVPIPVR
jgi:serine/threonine-protein kinase